MLLPKNGAAYTEFLMAYGSEKTRYENMKTRRVRIESKTNMATPGESLFSAPVLLTENEIPGASLQGRKPAEMKKADLLFWLRCRGDSCKGMTVKAQLVKRYVSVKFLMLLYWFLQEEVKSFIIFLLEYKYFKPKFYILEA